MYGTNTLSQALYATYFSHYEKIYSLPVPNHTRHLQYE